MDGISWLQILSYISLLILVGGVAARAIKYASMPMHLRWELYPLPHEGKDGSYFEELEWWKKPRKKHYLKKILFMAQEIIFVRVLYHHNRKMWYASFPFHFGLYLVFGWLFLLIVGAALNAFGVSAGVVNGLQAVTILIGVVGLFMGAVGCLGLLLIRMTAEELHDYTAPVDYFNLIFIFLIMLSGLISWISADPHFVYARDYFQGLITLSPVSVESAVLAIHITLFSLFFIYLPFTHMTHFVMKYFMWDKVRFEDEPNLKGSAVSTRVEKVLAFKHNWSAPHMNKGTKWSETASKGLKE